MYLKFILPGEALKRKCEGILEQRKEQLRRLCGCPGGGGGGRTSQVFPDLR